MVHPNLASPAELVFRTDGAFQMIQEALGRGRKNNMVIRWDILDQLDKTRRDSSRQVMLNIMGHVVAGFVDMT